MQQTLRLVQDCHELSTKMALDLEFPAGSDTGFTERFARKLFFDASYCFRQYVQNIRPHRDGTVRPESRNPLDSVSALLTYDAVVIEGQQVMQSWEASLMKRMAQILCRQNDTVLEIGFGLGISATEIQALRPKKHIIVEANPDVAAAALDWRKMQNSDVEIIHARWESLDFEGGYFDSVFFDTYPAEEVEIAENLQFGRVAAEKFFPLAERWCRSGGRFTFYTGNEIGLLLRIQDDLFKRFGKMTLERVAGLSPPADCNYWIASEMVIVVAEKLS